MESTKDSPKVIKIDGKQKIYSVMFAEDGKEVWSGGDEGMLRRWCADDGHEVGEPIENARQIYSAALSPDGKWLVCGRSGSGSNGEVWSAKTHEKVLDFQGDTRIVYTIDVSPDSTTFATGGYDKTASIWSMTTGEKLVGPLQHENYVVAVRFSPDGDRIATVAFDKPEIRIWDSNNGQQLLVIPSWSGVATSTVLSPLAWSNDSRQLYAISNNDRQVSRFDTSSGSLLNKWSVPASPGTVSVVISRNQKFAVVAASRTLSFWDLSTYTQIGTVIEHTSRIWSISLSPDDDCIATGEDNGRVTIRNLRDILPLSYFSINLHAIRRTFQLPYMRIHEGAYKLWAQGDITSVEQFLTEDILHPSDTIHKAHALANRSLVRTQSGNRDMAIDDANASIGAMPSVIGYIAHAMAYLCNGLHDSALRAFDLVFSDGLPSENNHLLLIKAIILFESGKRDDAMSRLDDAMSRLDDLIRITNDKPVYITVRAQMHLLHADIVLREGDHLQATQLLKRAREAPPPQESPHLLLISLIFGWDFDKLAPTIEQRIQECIKVHEEIGDRAMKAENVKDAVVQYSAALSLGPSNSAPILVKRSKARGMLKLWEQALKDADEAIATEPSNPLGHERRHAALHALRRFDEACDTFTHMLSLIENSPDEIVFLMDKKYVTRSKSEARIEQIVRGVFKICPIVLIDVQSGRLCDATERIQTFKSSSSFKELVSSMTEALDDALILRVVATYFQYVTFSHVWQGKEPSFQDVNAVASVWKLDSSPLNEKLKSFCRMVQTDGFRWAWSDTCCIDKTISTVLNQSLTMMYKWYEESAVTLVFLANANSVPGELTDSPWMTRAWTAQEVLAARVVRFYDRNWKLYMGDTCTNHKESPQIMQELTKAMGISEKTIAAFNPDDLSVREKLRIASTRNATVEEDMAYSLIGIFKSDIIPRYGEGDTALGHLLEEIVARAGEVTVLAWTGRSSSYNSCLPASLAVYNRPPCTTTAIDDAEMDSRVGELKNSISQSDVNLIYDRIIRLPPARFANRRLHLPCVIFPVKRLGVQDMRRTQGSRFRARVSGIGYVEFQTSDMLPLSEPRRLILVHPWLRDLRDPFGGFSWGSREDDGNSESDRETEAGSSPSSPMHALPSATMDDHTRALRLIARLKQPFHALLLEQQSNGEFKRVAAEHDIVVPGLERKINFAKDIRTEVVEIL